MDTKNSSKQRFREVVKGATPLEQKTTEDLAGQKRVRLCQGKIIHLISKVAMFGASMYLFILAIILMKDGARSLVPLLQDIFYVSNPANSLGFGWLFAYVVMSGSPVAAAALTFLDAGAIDTLSAFTMITGSRLGANFLVIFLGFLYILRGRDKASSLSMGLLSLGVTGTTHLAGLFVGIWMLQGVFFNRMQVGTGYVVDTLFYSLFTPITEALAHFLSNWLLFVVGIILIVLSFNLFDRCLPEMAIKDSQVGRISRFVYRPWVMFILGAVVTLLCMSVSISLGILVPLSQRGFIRRENVIPYIMGANVTTFIDTLLAAIILSNSEAITIVLVEILSMAMISILFLVLAFRPYERSMLRFVEWTTASNKNLTFVMFSIFAIPLLLLLL
jgi:Na+/phosphate symporter